MTSNELEAVWVAVFDCPCPRCGHPRLDHAVLGFQPQKDDLDTLKLGLIECDRCHEKFRPLSRECHLTILERRQRRDFQTHTPDK